MKHRVTMSVEMALGGGVPLVVSDARLRILLGERRLFEPVRMAPGNAGREDLYSPCKQQMAWCATRHC